jgi:hypothetical protein
LIARRRPIAPYEIAAGGIAMQHCRLESGVAYLAVKACHELEGKRPFERNQRVCIRFASDDVTVVTGD